jgi:hypothetical protein
VIVCPQADAAAAGAALSVIAAHQTTVNAQARHFTGTVGQSIAAADA